MRRRILLNTLAYGWCVLVLIAAVLAVVSLEAQEPHDAGDGAELGSLRTNNAIAIGADGDISDSASKTGVEPADAIPPSASNANGSAEDSDPASKIASAESIQAVSARNEDLPLGADAGLLKLPGSTLPRAGDSDDPAAASYFPDGWGEFMRTGAALAGVLMVMIALFALVRRFGGPFSKAGRPGGVLELLARFPVSRGQSLVLMKLNRRILLLHQSGSAMTTLSEITSPEEVASLLARVEAGDRDAQSRSFGRVFDGAMKSGRTDSSREEVETIDLTRLPRTASRWRLR